MPTDEHSEATPRRTRRRVAAATTVLLAVVAIVWFGPSLVGPFVAGRLSALLGADVRIGWITWNPLAGRIVLHHVAIAPTAGAPAIVTVQTAVVDVALPGWLHGERALDAIVLHRPWIALRRTAGGDFNVAELFSSLPAGDVQSPQPATPAATEPPLPVRIGLFRVLSGSIEFRDETTNPVLETSLHLDDASARDLVLASDGSAGLAVHVESRLENAPLTLDVDYETGTDSSRLTAKLVAADASLARALLYVPLGWQRTSGTMDVKVTYEREVEKNRVIRHTIAADLAVHELALTEPWAAEPMLQAKTVRVPALVVDLVKQRTDLGAIAVDDYRALVLRDDGRLHVPLASGGGQSTSSTWQTVLDRVRLGAGVAVLRNVFAVPETIVSLQSGTIELPADAVVFGFAGTVAGGSIDLAGRARSDTTRLSFTFHDLDLVAAAPLVGVAARFAKGRIGGSVDLVMTPAGASLSGTVSSTDASSAPSAAHPEEVFAWQRLDATLAESTLDPPRFALSRARIVWPYLMVHRRADGLFPLTQGTASTPVPSVTTATANEDPWLRIDRLDVEGGRVEFWDSTLPQPYGIDLTDLAGAVDGIALAPARVARLTVRGALDELSPVIVSGRIDPVITTLDLHVDRLLLPPLNPYLAPAIGYEVKSGLARITSDVRLEGTRVTAATDLVLSRFAMRAAGTDTVEGKIGTPLSVALALLKDTKGDIHLTLPIEGDVAASEYRVGSLLRDALGTALLGTLRAPLGFLRGLFQSDQGEQFDLRPVPFAAGNATLGSDGERRIAELARLLDRQTALRARLIPAPSRSDLDAVVAAGDDQPLDALARLARDRGTAVLDRLTHESRIDPKRIAVEPWNPVEPDIEGEPGVDVQLRTE